MTHTPTRKDLELLTEPTRSKALDNLQRMLQEGYDEDEAVEIAFREAEEWEVTHCPTATPPQEPPRLARLRTTSEAPNHPDDGTIRSARGR